MLTSPGCTVRTCLLSATLIATTGLFGCTGDVSGPSTSDPGASAQEAGVDASSAADTSDATAPDQQPTTVVRTDSPDDVKLATDVLMAFVASEQVDARNFSVTVTTDDAGETVAQLTPTDAATEAETQEASALAQNVEGIDSVQVDGEPAPHMEDEASEEAQEAVAAANEDTPRPTQDAGSTEFEEMEEAVEVGTPADVEAPELDEEEETSEEEEEVEPSEPEAEEDYRMYTIKRGDTLSIISARELGDGSRWTEIYELNRDIIGPNPDGIRDGMEIRLPEPAEE